MQEDVVIDLGPRLDAAAKQLGRDPLGGSLQILSLAFDLPTGRLAVGMPGRVVVCSLPDGAIVDEHVLLDPGAHAPVRLLFTSDGKHLAAACTQLVSNADSISSVFVLEQGKKKPVIAVPGAKALEKHDWDLASTHGVSTWALSPDGAHLATAWDVQGVGLWNLQTHRRERIVLKAPELAADASPLDVSAIAFAPDGETLAILVGGGLEVHPSAKGKRIARVDIDDTFGASRLAYTSEGIMWARAAPGTCETCLIDPHTSTVARRPVALDKVQPLRIDATSVLWRQEVGEGEAHEQVLVRQDLVSGHLSSLVRAPWSDDLLHPLGVITISPTQDRVARVDGRTVRVSSLA
jgi:hypothetical protein